MVTRNDQGEAVYKLAGQNRLASSLQQEQAAEGWVIKDRATGTVLDTTSRPLQDVDSG